MTVPQPFQYQGSKRALAPLILQYLPISTTRLVEPFCGSAALSIATAARGRAREFWLNDFNAPLAKLLSLIVNNPKELGKFYRELWRAGHERDAPHGKVPNAGIGQVQVRARPAPSIVMAVLVVPGSP
jgi:DNA adenine methylase